MWKPEEIEDAYSSENGRRTESWSRSSASGEQLDTLLSEYLQSAEATEGKANVEDHNPGFRARFEQMHPVGSSMKPQMPEIEVTADGHTNSWARQVYHETSEAPTELDCGSDSGLEKSGTEQDVVGEDSDSGCVEQTAMEDGAVESSRCGHSRHYSNARNEAELGRTLPSPLDSATPGQSSSTLLSSLVKPGSPHKHDSPSLVVNITPPVGPHPHLHSHPPSTTTLPSTSSSTGLNLGYLASSSARRPTTAIQQYRLVDERQAKRAPLWRRRVNYKSSLSEQEEMLATARPHAYDIANGNSSTMNEQLRYSTTQQDTSYFSQRDRSAAEPGDLFPLSPPLSSARSSFLGVNNNVAPHLNGNYNLSTESLPSVEANAINILSRPHSIPQLQEQMENPYSNTQPRHFVDHSPLTGSPGHEYLSPENSFEDGNMMKAHQPLSAYSSFNAPCPINESIELENGEDSGSSSAQGSSPQTWWAPGSNMDFQDSSTLIYPTSTGPPSSAGGFQSLPNMSPKRRFNQTPSNDNLRNQVLFIQSQQQPRSPMVDTDNMYVNLMGGQPPHSAMPSPPGSPGYFFSPGGLQTDGYCSPDPSAVNFIDPFNNSGSQHAPHQQFNTFPRRNPLPKSLLGYDTPVQGTTPIPIRTVPSHGHSTTRSSYLRKAGSLGRSGRMPPLGKNDPKEVAFVNFTPHDATKILSGVAPSGSSKTKARREREAQEKRRKLSEAAQAAVLAAGGDPTTITEMEF